MKGLLKRSPVIIASILFVVFAGVLYYIRPKLMFKNDGEMCEFGFEGEQTVFTYPVVLGVIAIFTYLLTFILVTFYNNRVNI